MARAAAKVVFAGGFGLCCLPSFAAEWAVAPLFTFDADHQSNRTCRASGQSSESLSAGVERGVVRRTETSEFSLLPHYYAQRFSGDSIPDIDDQRLMAALRLDLERGQLYFDAEYADESTLTTELAETGLIRADASRTTRGTSAAWTFAHSDSREFSASASFQDVSYSGGFATQLNGYRYAAVSANERFMFSPRWALTLGTFVSNFDSPTRGSRSGERGISLGFTFAWTERLNMAGTLGGSRRDIDGMQSNGTTGDFSLQYRGETRTVDFTAAHSLVPFGTGVLTERNTAELSLRQDFNSRLSATARVGFSRNEDAGFGITFDSRTYRFADSELRWQINETWSTAIAGGYADATVLGAPETFGGWSVALRSYWSPARRVFGH